MAATSGRRQARLHALIQRNRYAAKLAHRMTNGLLRRTVDGTKAVLAIVRFMPRAGSVDLVRQIGRAHV